MSQSNFHSELKDLEARFEAMTPELAETVRDQDAGVQGYVVVWNTDISVGGPLERMGKGGTRVTPKTDLNEIKMLARIMALKNAAAGLPLGGAKSGLKADSSAPDFEGKYRKFVSLCRPLLHENGGIFGGFGFDIGARPEMPHWACDELNSFKSFTGKPIDMGGTDYDKEGVAGLGVAVAAKTMLEYDGKAAHDVSFAVQGLGAMGAAIIKYFSEFGATLKAVSDPRIGGTVYFKDGAPEILIKAMGEGGIDLINKILSDDGYSCSDDLQEALYADVDVIFPAAVQDVIRVDTVQYVRAKYISEGANNPSSPEARTWLHENGIKLVPDFIANPGGVIAAFVELTSDISIEENIHKRVNAERAKKMTIDKISENVTRLFDLVHEHNIEPALAGKYIALKNIFKA